MATITGPDLIIADEPTTALDVTVQAQILEILRALKTERKTAIALVSHDMGVIAGNADRVQVMRQGEVVEHGPVDDIFYTPKNDYTRMLLAAMPRLDDEVAPPQPTADAPLLDVRDLKVSFPVSQGLFAKPKELRAVDGGQFQPAGGETLGVVGESGCGKSTLARAVLQLLPKKTARSSGWAAISVKKRARKSAMPAASSRSCSRTRWPAWTRACRSAFPSPRPLTALKPGLTNDDVQGRVAAMMRKVGLDAGWINRYPHELSGGQNQRVGIAAP